MTNDGKNSRLEAFFQKVEDKVSRSQTEGIDKRKKPAVSSVKVTVVGCERMQLLKPAFLAESPKWRCILTVGHFNIPSLLISTGDTESLYL